MISPRVGIALVLYNAENEVLMGRRKGDHGGGLYGLPGGHLENGETFAQCAIRETFEETGLTVDNPEFVALTNDIFPESGKHYITIFLKARHTDQSEPQTREPHKVESWEWHHYTKLPSNLFDPFSRYVAGDYEGLAFATIFEESD